MNLHYYTSHDIRTDRSGAAYWQVRTPGWYVFDGPEGDEVVSGPFPDFAVAKREYTQWAEIDGAHAEYKSREELQSQADAEHDNRCIKSSGSGRPDLTIPVRPILDPPICSIEERLRDHIQWGLRFDAKTDYDKVTVIVNGIISIINRYYGPHGKVTAGGEFRTGSKVVILAAFTATLRRLFVAMLEGKKTFPATESANAENMGIKRCIKKLDEFYLESYGENTKK